MTILQRLHTSVANGGLKRDAGQDAAALKLQHLANEIEAWRPGIFRRGHPPRGIYLWGEAGRGKSMLMDLFFAGVKAAPKRRVHFNAFMNEVHALLHEMRRREHVRDPIPLAARQLEQRLLCFDELQVEDVADAMIIGRLFEQLFARGTVIVATSNTAPDKLYRHGLNRQLFLPFIALIKQRMETVALCGRDHRRGLNGDHYHTGPGAEAAMDLAWKLLGGGEAERSLAVLGRTLQVPRAAEGAARFTFRALCEKPLGTADYLKIAECFHTVLIDAIPLLGPQNRDAARRFTLLIDTLYDCRVRLICSAAAEPDGLYPGGEEAFARTVSRLLEMRSDAYMFKAKP
jgi:cell division protein ZapE